MIARLKLIGKFRLKVVHPDGTIRILHATNTVMHAGSLMLLNRWLEGEPHDSFQGQYVGFVATAGFTSYVKTDILSSHPGWTELGSRNKLTPVSDTIAVDCLSSVVGQTAIGVVGAISTRGVMVCDRTSDNAGLLYSAADFDEGPQVIPAFSTVTVTYTLTMSA